MQTCIETVFDRSRARRQHQIGHNIRYRRLRGSTDALTSKDPDLGPKGLSTNLKPGHPDRPQRTGAACKVQQAERLCRALERPQLSGKERPLRTLEMVDLSDYGQPCKDPPGDLSVAVTAPLGLPLTRIAALTSDAMDRLTEDFGFAREAAAVIRPSTAR